MEKRHKKPAFGSDGDADRALDEGRVVLHAAGRFKERPGRDDRRGARVQLEPPDPGKQIIRLLPFRWPLAQRDEDPPAELGYRGPGDIKKLGPPPTWIRNPPADRPELVPITLRLEFEADEALVSLNEQEGAGGSGNQQSGPGVSPSISS